MSWFDRILMIGMHRREPSMAARIFGGVLMLLSAIGFIVIGILTFSLIFVLIGVIELLVVAVIILYNILKNRNGWQ